MTTWRFELFRAQKASCAEHGEPTTALVCAQSAQPPACCLPRLVDALRAGTVELENPEDLEAVIGRLEAGTGLTDLFVGEQSNAVIRARTARDYCGHPVFVAFDGRPPDPVECERVLTEACFYWMGGQQAIDLFRSLLEAHRAAGQTEANRVVDELEAVLRRGGPAAARLRNLFGENAGSEPEPPRRWSKRVV